MAIGQISLGLRLRLQNPLTRPPIEARSEQLAREMPLLSRADFEPVGAGFGDGTVSVPAETVRALGRNMKSVRNLVPNAEEARERVQQRIAERRQKEPIKPPTFEPLNLNPSRAVAGRSALALINDINEAAKTAQRFTGDQETESQEDGPSIRVGEETFPLRRANSTPLLDVFA